MIRRSFSFIAVAALVLGLAAPIAAQDRGAASITAAELKVHLDFIASDEFAGRNTPSTELKITSRYLANLVESYGFRPLMPDGSFFQNLPLEVTSFDPDLTQLKVTGAAGEQVFRFPQAFGLGRSSQPGDFTGELVFVGYGLDAADLGWDDYGDIDLTGKIAVMVDGQLPDDHVLRSPENARILRRRSFAARSRGAVASVNVISPQREANFEQEDLTFDNPERLRVIGGEEPQQTASGTGRIQPFVSIEVRHDVATALLGISKDELNDIFDRLAGGDRVEEGGPSSAKVEITVALNTRHDYSSNVVAVLEGSDPVLKSEYVLFGSHHDHLGTREGQVYNGADDNGSGTVAMLEIAQAFSLERPKRSVIMVWHTAEEKGLWGSEYFMANSPVPYDKMSAELNMDMICRNDPEGLYLIGSDQLSTELDAVIRSVNDRHTHFNFDYTYNDPAHPDRFFFRSDQYPYIQYGVPAVWFFCGTTEDYHQPTDTVDRVDYQKMARVTRLVYLVGYEIGDRDGMLKLNAKPEITSRGSHNLRIRWRP